MEIDIFLMKGDKLVSTKSDERSGMSVAFLQDSTTYLVQLNMKLDGK